MTYHYNMLKPTKFGYFLSVLVKHEAIEWRTTTTCRNTQIRILHFVVKVAHGKPGFIKFIFNGESPEKRYYLLQVKP